MKTVTIREITINDINKLQHIERLTFSETFSTDNNEEDMNKYLETSFSTEKIKIELQDNNSIFYFAMYNEEPIGYLKLNWGKSQTEIKTENSLEIERIYILKEFHGKKIGQLLFEKALEIAQIKNVNYIWLGVWEYNTKAIHFYEKNGFVAFDKHVFKLGNDLQTDIMMKRVFNS
ncbi:GNAT family N-acetyltransferase [Chishuiella sp.]|uniref:GNAT family N-acetyltransferase n=1 Tax=Chishuiella sp. TaxID=1969467 RepID=UPI0028AA5716|nr:GNAT family N-acetyltransferase [Chishuiella sp.]